MPHRSVEVALLIGALSAPLLGHSSAQDAPKSTGDIQTEARKARELYTSNNCVDALPLYEDLHRQDPKNVVYDEALGFCLLFNRPGDTSADLQGRRERSHKILLEAKAGGDNSNLLQTLLETPAPAPAIEPTAKTPYQEVLDQAELKFGKGDLRGALELYTKAFAIDPRSYQAALFAGDAEFKLKEPDAAGAWFAKAIAIDPDRETAYRYWGDTLEAAGRHDEAKEKLIQAVIAEPYRNTVRLGLKQWADRNGELYAGPPITIPKRAEPDAKGNLNVNIDPATLGSPTGFVWMMYPMSAAIWQKDKFHKTYPGETKYRDSLAEQVDALGLALTVARERKLDINSDTTLRLLNELQKKGLLECYILLDHPDQGIAQDYVAYRAEHRDLLAKYMAEYDLRPLKH